MLGFLLGIRKGIFRKILYATTGGAAAAAVCYPKEAGEYAKLTYTEIKGLLTSHEIIQGILLKYESLFYIQNFICRNPCYFRR